MGISASTAKDGVSEEQREVENLAASVGSLPALCRAASKLGHPETKEIPVESLQQCLSISYKNSICNATMAKVPESILGLLDHLGSSIVHLFFMSEKGSLDWLEFVRGYVNCCEAIPASMRLTNLLRLFDLAVKKSGLSVNLEFESDVEDACKVSGYLMPSNVFAILMICWSMTWSSRCSKAAFYVPDLDNLVLSAAVACGEDGSSLDVWNCDVFSSAVQIPAGKFLTWALATVPGLPDCFSQFVLESLQNSVSLEEDEPEPSSSSSRDIKEGGEASSYSDLLTFGRAWAISLSFKSSTSEEILRHCFPSNVDEIKEDLIYCSSVHGKGLNRFWANVDGYHGPLLVLISAFCDDSDEGNSSRGKKWIIGVLLQQGFENKDHFYGSSGNLYVIHPLFNVFSASGKDKNFVYSHLHPTVKVYEAHPKPVGIGFGGRLGNERIFIDEDFAKVTIRHHSVDKTYRHGPLFPDQGYLPVEASIQEVQIWGLGGNKAKEMQTSYKKREDLFTEQRRKIDLKTFASWEDSPEKMMMDMVSDPNRVKREDR